MAIIKRRLLHKDPDTGLQDTLYFETSLDMVKDDEDRSLVEILDTKADSTDVEALATKTTKDISDLQETINNDIGKRLGDLQTKTEKDISDLQETINNDIGQKITTINGQISDIEADVAAEDTAMGARVDELAADCTARDTTMGQRVDALTDDVTAKDTAMGKRVDDLSDDVTAKDTAVNARVDTVAADLAAADTRLTKAITDHTTDYQTTKADHDARLEAAEAALTTLNGEGEGSVKKSVADGITSIVAGAPESFDTLKEMADWISTHETDATGMNTRITNNTNAISALTTRVTTAESDIDSLETRATAVEAKATDNATNITNLSSQVTVLNNWKAAVTIPVLAADPASPVAGQVWIRS